MLGQELSYPSDSSPSSPTMSPKVALPDNQVSPAVRAAEPQQTLVRSLIITGCRTDIARNKVIEVGGESASTSPDGLFRFVPSQLTEAANGTSIRFEFKGPCVCPPQFYV